MADIELSDDVFFHYKAGEFSKSDVERVIDQLDDYEKLEFYHL